MKIITDNKQLELLIWLAQLYLDRSPGKLINMWITRLAEGEG